MAKTIFTTKVEPTYDDLPEVRYHFPKSYLNAAERSVGDWIIYYEPRRISGDLNSSGGRQSYFATAKVSRIEKDHKIQDHFYAYVNDYMEFPNPVSFREGVFYYESGLQRDDGKTNKGAFGRAIRNIPDNEYELILAAGFSQLISREQQAPKSVNIKGLSEPSTLFERPIVESIVKRPFRDRAFRKNIYQAYNSMCAVTGIKMLDGKNHAEIEAAHIHPVEQNGPDTIRNGIALTRTAHWMFDKGLMSFENNGEILLAKDKIPDKINSIINLDNKILLPNRPEYRPHPKYLGYHRENIFKG
jgi:putative restriction endonuclease